MVPLLRGLLPLKKGFTLIELMLVVAIIGLLAAISLPKFASLVIKAKEAAVKGKMGTLRSAVTLYYADNEGRYPFAGASYSSNMALIPKYLDAYPAVSIPTIPSHVNGSGIYGDNPFLTGTGMDSTWVPINPMPWRYDTVSGLVLLNCSHTDSQGRTWSLF